MLDDVSETRPDRGSTAGSTGDLPVVAVYREMLLNFNEPFLRNQAEGLKRFRAWYVCDRRVPGGPALPDERTFALREHYARADEAITRILSALPKRIVPRGIAHGELAARAGSYLFRELGRARPLERRLRDVRAVLLHAHTGLSGAHVLPLARRLGLPLVVTYHGYEATATDRDLAGSRRRGRVFLRRRERMKREVAKFVAVSDFMRELMRAQGYPDERTVRLYTGVDTRLFRPAPEVAREPVVLFAGRLLRWKGVSTLLDAMQAVRQQVPGVRLVIAGSGPLQEELEDQARRLGVEAQFLGALPPPQVRDWMHRASVLAIPSIRGPTGQVEALGGVAVEALASGLPIVGSDSGGIPEVVDDGVTGLLVAPGDPGALARAVVRLMTDTALTAQMGGASRAKAVRDFDIERQTAKLEALYDEVLAGRGRQG